jgi:hypothetical protein
MVLDDSQLVGCLLREFHMQVLRTIAIAAAMMASPSFAATVFSVAGPTAAIASPGAYTYNFNAPAGAGSVSFDINGYASLDGVNCCTDTFTLNLNGTDIYSAAFALGGGGANAVFLAPAGATQTATEFGFFAGGVASVYVPLTLLAGSNVLTFSYSGAAQGTGDESWGLSNVSVSAVPEPQSWALMIAGFGLVGASMRRRSVARAA